MTEETGQEATEGSGPAPGATEARLAAVQGATEARVDAVQGATEETRAQPERRITRDEYLAAMAVVENIGKLAYLLPLDKMLQAMETADAVGWAVDPTLYRAAHVGMDEQRDLVRAVRGVQAVVERQVARLKVSKQGW